MDRIGHKKMGEQSINEDLLSETNECIQHLQEGLSILVRVIAKAIVKESMIPKKELGTFDETLGQNATILGNESKQLT